MTKFLSSLNQLGHRIDGRGKQDYRKVTFELFDQGILICLGKTCAVATYACDVVRPKTNPTQGMLNFRIEERGVQMSRLVDKAIKVSKAVDLEGLCLLPHEAVWSIRVDVRMLHDDGNSADALFLAALGAVIRCRRPEVLLEQNTVTLVDAKAKPFLPLGMYHFPICVSFCFLGSLVIVDPCKEEEEASEGVVRIVMNLQQEVCCIHKADGFCLPVELLEHCISIAQMKVEEMTQLIKSISMA